MKIDETDNWFESFCRQEYVAVYRYVYAHTGNVDDAREAVQESFLGLYRLSISGGIKEHPRALLFRIARHKAIDLLRQRARRQTTEDQGGAEKVLAFRLVASHTPEDLLLAKERRRIAEEAIAQLSERDQEALTLRCSGLTNDQVASVLQVTSVTVRQIISRALRRFEQSYDRLLEESDASLRTGRKRQTKGEADG